MLVEVGERREDEDGGGGPSPRGGTDGRPEPEPEPSSAARSGEQQITYNSCLQVIYYLPYYFD